MSQYQQVSISAELNLCLDVCVPLAALSVNFQGKYLSINGKVMFIFETKLFCYFN